MANIKDNFVLFSSDSIYNQHISELTPETIAFVLKRGEEKLITQNKLFYFIPTNGNPGQVLKARDGYFSWGDLYSVRVNNSVTNLRSDDAIQVITLNSTADTTDYTVNFINDFTIGGNCTLYLTQDNDSTYQPIVKINSEKFIGLNNQYEIPLNKGEWVSIYFFCTGGYIYFIVNDLGKNLDEIQEKMSDAYLFTEGEDASGKNIDNSVVMNDTNITKNVYELSVGKYNASTRQTGTEFGVKNSIFTVGNGTETQRHDAFRVLQNGELEIVDIYNGTGSTFNDRGMMILQDKLAEYEGDIQDLREELDIYKEKISELEDKLNQLLLPPNEDEVNNNGDAVDSEASEQENET